MDRGVVELVEELCKPTGASVGKYFEIAAKDKMLKAKIRDSEKFVSKKSKS